MLPDAETSRFSCLLSLIRSAYHRGALKWIPDATDLWRKGSARCVLKRVTMNRGASTYEVRLYDGVAVTRSDDFDDYDRAITFAVELFRATHRDPFG
jgi:hypothetical protein